MEQEKVGKFIKKNERKFIDFFFGFLNCCKIFFRIENFWRILRDEDGQDLKYFLIFGALKGY